MKPFLILVSLLLGILPAVAEEQVSKIAESELRALEGEYTFNPSDTDEMATVQVKFRRSTEKEGEGEWRADGTMDNSFHGTVVTFKGARVYKDGDEVVIHGQFFGFKLKKGVLDWLKNYDRQLYLEPKEPAKKAGADQPATRSKPKPEAAKKPKPGVKGR